jgi:hypothetical protein
MKNLLLCMVVTVSCAGCGNMTTQPAGVRTILAFSASYCSGCVSAKKEIARLMSLGAPIRVVDCASEAGKAEAGRHGITELPTFILLLGGVESARTNDVYTVRKWCGG